MHKPAAQAVGEVASGLLKRALWPLRMMDKALERLQGRVERKLLGVPVDHLLPPPAAVAGATAWHYAMLGEGDEVTDLREMFENLLVASMDRRTTTNAHPAFVSMVSQLTPDEARILKSIDQPMYAAFDVFERRPGEQISHGLRTMLGVSVVTDERRRQQCISNLERLGILRVDPAMVVETEYDALSARIEAEFGETDVTSTGGAVRVTPLGQQFLDTCVRSRRT